MIQIGSLFTHRSLAIVYLIVMCTQILFVEGFGVSPLKIVLMSLAPFILTTKVPYLSKAFLIGTLYIIVVFFVPLCNLMSVFPPSDICSCSL